MNDSGLGADIEERVCFNMEVKTKNSKTFATIRGRPTQSLADAINEEFPKFKLDNCLIWAEISGLKGRYCVPPFSLPCSLLQPDQTIQWKQVPSAIYNWQVKPNVIKEPSSFSVVVGNRANQLSITNAHHEKFGQDPILVLADGEQTYKAALEKDGRFKNVNCIVDLKKKMDSEGGKVEGEGASTNINHKVSEVRKHLTFEVITKRRLAPKSDASFSNESLGVKPSKEAKLTSAEPVNLLEKLKKNGGVEVTTAQENRTKIQHHLKVQAFKLLLGPNVRSGNHEKALEDVAKVQFANRNIEGRPVSFAKKICPLYDSIGFIQCGTVWATGFLVSKSMIITNYHVVDDIRKARTSSTHGDHSKVHVCFRFEQPGQKREELRCYQLLPLEHPDNILCEDLDYAFLGLTECVEGSEGLGKYVSCFVPDRGEVYLVGHPLEREKLYEYCPLLPFHDGSRRLEMEKRYEEWSRRCQSNPANCWQNMPRNEAGECIHVYQEAMRNLCFNEKALTYDVGSMFKGSSGAPVFTMSCDVVGLHSAGFLLGGSSVVEVGVTFRAVINSLIGDKRREDFVMEHFPNCWNYLPKVVSMEVESEPN